jgi:hypothetical protein
MFGQLKESILSNLEKTYQNKGEKDFKESFAKYVKVLKENNTLREFTEVYDLLNTMRFEDESIAKEFVEESIEHLKSFNLSDVDKLKSLTEESISIEGTINESIDKLVFSKKLSLVEKVKHKTNLIKHLTRVEKSVESLTESIEKINNSLTDKISKLNEEQVKVLNLFAENDESAINNYYTNLIESTQNVVEETINNADDIIIVKKLLEVRTKLNEMKNEKPSLETIDNIIDLKKSFE